MKIDTDKRSIEDIAEEIAKLWGKRNGTGNEDQKTYLFLRTRQGVGFRYYAVQKAEELGLNGWVRNLYDDSVEMEVEGEEADIDQLILFLQNRTYIWIEDMKVKSMPVEGGYGFYVKEDE